MIVRIRGVKKTRSAAGRVYYYHRATKTRIKAKPNTPEFVTEIAELNKRGTILSSSPATSGTFGALVAAYRASPEFQKLADRTRADYQSVLDWLRGIDRMPIVQLDGPALLAIRDRAFSQRKRRFANHVTQVLGTVLNWGRARKLSFGNPLIGMRNVKIARPRDLPRANRPWTDAETWRSLKPHRAAFGWRSPSPVIPGCGAATSCASLGQSTTARRWNGGKARQVTPCGCRRCRNCAHS